MLLFEKKKKKKLEQISSNRFSENKLVFSVFSEAQLNIKRTKPNHKQILLTELPNKFKKYKGTLIILTTYFSNLIHHLQLNSFCSSSSLFVTSTAHGKCASFIFYSDEKRYVHKGKKIYIPGSFFILCKIPICITG